MVAAATDVGKEFFLLGVPGVLEGGCCCWGLYTNWNLGGPAPLPRPAAGAERGPGPGCCGAEALPPPGRMGVRMRASVKTPELLTTLTGVVR